MDPSLGILAIILLSGSLFAIIFLLVLHVRIGRTIRFVENQLPKVEEQLREYRSLTKYLRRKDRVTLGESLNLLAGSLRFLRTYRVFLDRRQGSQAELQYARVNELVAFLERFIPEFTKREVERYKDFFDSSPLDGEQIEAVVKRDTYNLVIAAAGSGKTRALTARIAFLVRTGTAPDAILALAYTRAAAEEMQSRLKNDYHIPNANVRTFHSLGRELAMRSKNFRSDVADSAYQHKFIANSFKRLAHEQRHFAMPLLDYAIESHARELEQTDFPNPEEYYEYLRSQKYTALNWTKVSSIAERDIANCLFLNGVRFEYETRATWADKNPEYRQYRPDFHLPEHGIWIEHWGIDRQGNVPPWFSARHSSDPSTGYRKGMEWKRGQYKKHGRKLIETYQYQWMEGTLIAELKQQLQEKGVELRELTMPQILDRIHKLIPHTDPLHELMFSFISKAKTNGLSINDVTSRLARGTWSRKQRSFAGLMIPVWQAYESSLVENDMMDFNDMINHALEVARQERGELSKQYSHILVDEFQDITDPQLELIKCFLRADGSNTLFSVGDDWQNIFSFAGSNVYNVLNFDANFPYVEKTVLSKNYRCPKNVVEASNSIAKLNRSKIDKTVIPVSNVLRPISLIEMPNNDIRDYEEWEIQRAQELLKELIANKKPEEEIMVLSRFNKPLERLKLEFPKHETLGLSFLTIHRAKGTEADYVLLLGCVSGWNGFPSEMMDENVLEIVRNNHENEADKLEEERRLFYVALTRCKNQLFLFTSRKAMSQFVSELEPYLTIR